MSIETQFFIMIDPDYLLDPTRKSRIMTPEAYVNEVRAVISNLTKSAVGRAVLETIRVWKRGVRIAPVDTGGVDVCGVEVSDGGRIQVRDLQFNAVLPLLKIFKPEVFAIRSTVHFIPRLDMSVPKCKELFGDAKKNDYRPTPEEVLIHELTHAIRNFTFTEKGDQPDLKIGPKITESNDEFVAILVENMFQSEKGANIRFSHDNFTTLDAKLQESFEYFKFSKIAFRAVETFVRVNPFFTERLRKTGVKFNPLEAFRQNPVKCRQMSELALQ